MALNARLALSAIATAAAAASALAQPTPCCAYGGTGNAVLYTAATIDLADGKGVRFTELTFAVNAVMRGLTVMVGTDPQQSEAGWIINEWRNATGAGQTLTFWYGNTEGATPTCYSGSVAYPDQYAPGFHMCAGASADSLFPTFAASYTTPDGTGVLANLYGQPSGSRGMFTPATMACAPTSILAMGSPFGKAAWTATVQNGTDAQPPAALLQPPAFCGSATA